MENFENHMIRYAEERGFVWNSVNSALWQKCLQMFNLYQTWFQKIMGYKFFVENVIAPANSLKF